MGLTCFDRWLKSFFIFLRLPSLQFSSFQTQILVTHSTSWTWRKGRSLTVSLLRRAFSNEEIFFAPRANCIRMLFFFKWVLATETRWHISMSSDRLLSPVEPSNVIIRVLVSPACFGTPLIARLAFLKFFSKLLLVSLVLVFKILEGGLECRDFVPLFLLFLY